MQICMPQDLTTIVSLSIALFRCSSCRVHTRRHDVSCQCANVNHPDASSRSFTLQCTTQCMPIYVLRLVIAAPVLI